MAGVNFDLDFDILCWAAVQVGKNIWIENKINSVHGGTVRKV